MIGRIARALVVCVLVGAFLWGLFVFGSTRTPDLQRLFILISVPTGAALLGLFGPHPYRIAAAPWMLALGGVLFLGVARNGTVEARGYLLLALGWAAFLLTLAIAGRSKRACKWFLLGLLLVGFLEALYGFAQAVGGMDYIGDYHRGMGRVATGTLFNRNHYAGFLNLVIPLTLGAFLVRREADRSNSEELAAGWVVVLVTSLMGLAVLLSQSRGGTVSLALCLSVTALLLFARRREGASFTAFAPWLFLVLVVGMGLGVGVQSLLTKFVTAESGLRGRAAIYADTLNLIADHPFVGVGPGMYAWRFRPYQSVSGDVWFDYAHNDYLQTTAEWGVPVSLMFWAWVFWRLFGSVRFYFGSRDRWLGGLSLGCAISLFSILLHSMVDFNLYIPTTFMVFCSVLGLSVVVRKLDAPSPDPSSAGGETW